MLRRLAGLPVVSPDFFASPRRRSPTRRCLPPPSMSRNRPRPDRKPRCSRAAASGVCEAVFRHVTGVSTRGVGLRGGTTKKPTYEMVEQRRDRATRKRWRSRSIRRRCRTDSCCACSSRWRTTRPSSTGRGPTSARSIARRSSTSTTSSGASPQAYIAQLDRRQGVPEPDRDAGVLADRVLSGRGLSPELPRPASDAALHRVQRPAEARGAEGAVPELVRGALGVAEYGCALQAASGMCAAHGLRLPLVRRSSAR